MHCSKETLSNSHKPYVLVNQSIYQIRIIRLKCKWAALFFPAFQNIISTISLFLSMVLLLAVIIAEAPDSSSLRRALSLAKKDCENTVNSSLFEFCKAAKAAISWHNTMVFLSDIILFLCLLALLAVFANVILVSIIKVECILLKRYYRISVRENQLVSIDSHQV